MSKRTTISALHGRVIEEVIVYHDDGNENPVCLDIRCVGGQCLSFSLTAKVTATGVATVYRSVKGNVVSRQAREFIANGTVPYAPDDTD